MSRVLIVDDAAANRLVLKALLTRAGYEVQVADGGSSAMSQMDSFHPDAVITDLHMADENEGLQLARALRQRETANGSRLRLALMTGDAGSFADTVGLFDAVLDKPVALADVREFLEGQ